MFVRNSALTDLAVQQRNRQILGLPPTNTIQRCICGKDLDATHAVACIQTRKICAESRHDMVRDTVKQALDRYNISSFVEYRPISHSKEDGKPKRVRPDGFTNIMNDMWDVCVTTPTCQSYIDRNSDSKGLVAAKVNESVKCKKYIDLATKEGHTFTPLVFESYGGFGEKARDFIRRAADVGVDVAGGGVMDRTEIMHDIRCSIAFSIINGNARLIKNGMLLAERRKIPTLPRAMLQVRRLNGVVSAHARHPVRRRH